MRKACLLDSDILSFYLRGDASVVHQASSYLKHWKNFTFSHVTYYEILRGLKKIGSIQQERLFKQFSASCQLLPVTQEIWEIAAALYEQLANAGKLIPDADLLIASTALYYDHTLVTHNTKHFSRIPDLDLADWA